MQPGDIYSPPPGSQQHQQHNHQHPQAIDPFANPPPLMDNRPYTPLGQGQPGAGGGGDWQQAPYPPGGPGAPLGHSQSHSSFNQAPYGLHDTSITSPPPLLPSQSISDFSAPHSGPGFPQPQGYGHPLEDDYNDAQPLLNHAYPDQRFGAQPAAQPSPGLYDPPLQGQASGGHIRFNEAAGAGPGEPNNLHYGLPPNRQLRRNRTQKRVQLFRGHLVLDVDVPSMLLSSSPVKQGNEFTKMRYTAVTCDPDEFDHDQYTLRQRLYEPVRHTELFIVVTMYNEDDILFCRTMRGIMQNIAHLCSRNRSKTWGEDGWKKVVVCIVSDGRLKINPRTRSVLAALGVYQDGVAKNVVNGKPVTAHLYEYTTQLWIDSKGKVGPGGNHAVPVQLMFCLKEKNQKKINSHRWFFNAFGECLRPNVCVLLDVGTQPGPDSIYHLWKAFDINSSVGGACGEIVALKGMFWKNLINPLVAAQNFEYKMSNILDKPLESAFGYITVLPGAFSAYRYIALQNDERGKGPLEKYFLGETLHGTNAGIFESNMYLAEDRILCWELVSKRASRWTLHYVKSAYAITDVPDTVAELVSQRRRWLNGSFFAAVHAIAHFGYLYRSSHSIFRMFFLHIEFIYQIVNNVFAWFALGNFYIAFVVLSKSLELSYEPKPGEPLYDEHGNRKLNDIFKWINIPLGYLYLALLLLCFLLSLGNRPAGSVVGYTISMIGFAIITLYMLFAAVWLTVKGVQALKPGGESVRDLIKNSTFRNIIMSLAATYGLYIVASIISLDPWHMFTSFLQYLLLAPSYINVLNVYAFSNVHDVSWGTKGSDKVNEDLGVVKSSGEKNEVTIDAYFEQRDINATYQHELNVLATKPPKEAKSVNAEQAQEDYYKNFRTNVLLAWTMTNAALAIVMVRVGTDGKFVIAETYMAVMLYTVAGLAFFRFLGACVYLLLRLFMGE